MSPAVMKGTKASNDKQTANVFVNMIVSYLAPETCITRKSFCGRSPEQSDVCLPASDCCMPYHSTRRHMWYSCCQHRYVLEAFDEGDEGFPDGARHVDRKLGVATACHG